jgi:hypothetical protein
MRRLIEAIDSLAARIAGQDKVLRIVAAALYRVGTEVPAQIESWSRQGVQWREELVQAEMVELLDSIESLFEWERSADDLNRTNAPDTHPQSIQPPNEYEPTSRRRSNRTPNVSACSITIESRRKNLQTLERAAPGALILDMTSRAEEPWVRFSPFYPHGDIPVPNSPGLVGQSVEGLWQGLKVFEHEDVDPSRWEIADMRGIKRAGAKRGKILGHRLGPGSEVLLGYREARYQIYLPAYLWVLEHRLQAEVEQLRREWADRPLVLLDYETNRDVDNLSRPLSHAALVKAYLEDTWPAPTIDAK